MIALKCIFLLHVNWRKHRHTNISLNFALISNYSRELACRRLSWPTQNVSNIRSKGGINQRCNFYAQRFKSCFLFKISVSHKNSDLRSFYESYGESFKTNKRTNLLLTLCSRNYVLVVCLNEKSQINLMLVTSKIKIHLLSCLAHGLFASWFYVYYARHI